MKDQYLLFGNAYPENEDLDDTQDTETEEEEHDDQDLRDYEDQLNDELDREIGRSF